jgi:hypothetical protein
MSEAEEEAVTRQTMLPLLITRVNISLQGMEAVADDEQATYDPKTDSLLLELRWNVSNTRTMA